MSENAQHVLRMKTVANGAGRYYCSCGAWQSRVVDDGYMFLEQGEGEAMKAHAEWAAHVIDCRTPTTSNA